MVVDPVGEVVGGRWGVLLVLGGRWGLGRLGERGEVVVVGGLGVVVVDRIRGRRRPGLRDGVGRGL